MKKTVFILIACFIAPFAQGVPHIDVTPLSVDFGVVQIGAPQTVTITMANVGDSAITIETIEFQPGSSPDYALTPVPWLPIFFSAGGSFSVDVTFTPTVPGPAAASLDIHSSDPDHPVVTVMFSATVESDDLDPLEQIEKILDTANSAIEDGTLTGKGRGKSSANRLNAFANMLHEAQFLIAVDELDEAAGQLHAAYIHADGLDHPSDFVQGPAAAQLAEMILELIDDIAEL